MKNSNIRPVGLKGQENISRMKDLMDITPIKESVNRSVVEISKMGPDGKAYAIVKENSEYYIKVSDKTENLVTEDFNYMGGLMNKKSEAYPSYAKATKHLNLKFMSLAESLGTEKVFNILRNDNLLNEGTDINGGDAKVDKKTSGDNLATGDNIGEDDFEKAKADGTKDGNTGTHAEKHVMEEVELTEDETYIDEMIDPSKVVEEEEITESKTNKGISIAESMEKIDGIIDSVTPSDKVNEILEGLTESETLRLAELLKKKA